MTTYLRPTGLVDAPFGLDGQVARLAGGMLWFSAVEWIETEGARRVSAELVPVAGIEARLAGSAQATAIWERLTSARAPLTLGERVIRLDQPQVVGILNVTPDSFRMTAVTTGRRAPPTRARTWRRRVRRSSMSAGNRRGRARSPCGKAMRWLARRR